MSNAVIDITDLVEKTRSAFVDWAVLYVFGLEAAIPGMEWVALPVISTIDKAIIREVIDVLSKSAIMLAFFTNTVLRKASQADDFTSAVDAVNKLPENVSDAEYEAAEAKRMQAFRDFVTLSN